MQWVLSHYVTCDTVNDDASSCLTIWLKKKYIVVAHVIAWMHKDNCILGMNMQHEQKILQINLFIMVSWVIFHIYKMIIKKTLISLNLKIKELKLLLQTMYLQSIWKMFDDFFFIIYPPGTFMLKTNFTQQQQLQQQQQKNVICPVMNIIINSWKQLLWICHRKK